MRISLVLSLSLLSAVTVWAQQPTAPPPLDFEGAHWIWTSEMKTGTGAVASRPFRKVFTAPTGKIPLFVHTVSTADDGHKLYINGVLITEADSINNPRAACAPLNPGSNIFAIRGTNTGGAASVLAKFRITYSDGTTDTVVTDSSWKGATSVPAGFEKPGFNDSPWGYPPSYGRYGVAPWNKPHPAQEVPRCPQFKPVESELECSAKTGRYLSAVPGVGCVCLSERTPSYCGTPVGDSKAVQKCLDKTGSDGKREIKCYVECSRGLVATDQNTCSAPQTQTPQQGLAQTPLGSCPVGCVPFDCAIDKAKQESKDEEERREREEARKEREEAKKAREEAYEFREQQRAAMELCGCANAPSVPSTAPSVPSTVPSVLSIARPCSEPFPLTWSSPTSRCGCVGTFNQAQRRDPNAVQCLPPANHGQVACQNTGPASSRCNIVCDDGFQLTPDQTDCIATTRNDAISEFDCSADAEKPGFLTADPLLGCICADAKTENFCGVSAGHPDAEMMCFDTTDSWGYREAKCEVQCPDGFTVTDQNTCEVIKVKDDFERPCIEDAPARADANMQALIEHTMEKLNIARCENGFEFIKTATGYQCTGGGHWVTFEQLGMN